MMYWHDRFCNLLISVCVVYWCHPPGTRHERVPAKFWRSDSDLTQGYPAFQGTGTGSTGYPGWVPGQHMVLFTVVKRA